MSQRHDLGRTRLDTIRERRRRIAAIALGLAGLVLCAWLAAAAVAWVSGHGFTFPRLHVRALQRDNGGGLLGLPTAGTQPRAAREPQFPVTLSWPSSVIASAAVTAGLWALWLRYLVGPLLRGLRREARHRGLASVREIRAQLGARHARRMGRLTLPGTSWPGRVLRPMSDFGYFLGRPIRPRAAQVRLWANWEERVRVVARSGWGKTARVLVPIIRQLPGAAMISSIEPKIFEQTVTARQYRRRGARWPWLGGLLRRWRPLAEYPIAVIDFSAPETRFASGFPAVRWTPIPGCERYAVAFRRAGAMVSGVESETEVDRGSGSDKFFRDSATAVLAAWLHAAALGARSLTDMADWITDIADPLPRTILSDDPRAERSAVLNLNKHLADAAKNTTSGVERYLTLAMESLLSEEGSELIEGPAARRDGAVVPSFAMAEFIAKGGTLYILADAQLIERVRPLLSMVASEMFIAAEAAANATRDRQLPVPFIGVIDELRYGVTVSNLPYVANVLRKNNIGYIYTVQSASQEDVVFGKDAAALRAAAGVSVYGGIDFDSAQEITERAGPTPVVTATRGQGLHTEHIQLQDTITVADQQQLGKGEATIVRAGLRPFFAYLPSFRDRRRTRRRVEREAREVAQRVEHARAGDLVARRSRATAGAAGATFGGPATGGRPTGHHLPGQEEPR